MRVRVQFTVDVDYEARLLIQRYNNLPYAAYMDDVRAFFETHGTNGWNILDDVAVVRKNDA